MQPKASRLSSRNESRCGAIARKTRRPETVRREAGDASDMITLLYRVRHGRSIASAALRLAVVITLASGSFYTLAQRGQDRSGSHTSHSRDVLSPEAGELVELASVVVCKERIGDPKASIPIDDMQGRPSLPVQSPEAMAGVQRAQRLLPIARELVVLSLRQLVRDYNVSGSKGNHLRIQRAISRVEAVKNIRPDVDSRDNASVFLRNPHTITFGTIFLAGLPSDEGIISVLAHELVHIADGSEDSLRSLFRALGNRASQLVRLKINGQRAEELTCDLVGMLVARD